MTFSHCSCDNGRMRIPFNAERRATLTHTGVIEPHVLIARACHVVGFGLSHHRRLPSGCFRVKHCRQRGSGAPRVRLIGPSRRNGLHARLSRARERRVYLCQLAAVLVALSGMTVLAAAQQPTQEDFARILRSGALNDRHQAARDVLQMPPEQRGGALLAALANELQRVASESHARDDALNAGREVSSLGEDDSDYYQNLVKVVSQWRDPRALEPLISSAGRGMLVIRGIVSFGEMAVPPLIDVARTGHRGERGGVLLTLQVLLEGSSIQPYNIPPTQLSPAAREQIVRFARDLLGPGAPGWRDLAMEAGLALATGDEDLRRQVELLASEPGLVAQSTGLGDPNEIARIQNAIRFRLDQHKR